MMVLALETATLTGSVALVDDERGLLGEVTLNIKVAHAERLMTSIDWLLESTRTAVNDIDAFAISIGPGSFTGLRIGLSTVKGLSFATGRPIMPVPTLDALAMTLPFCQHLICPMLDAKKNEVYAALYKWRDGACEKLLAETAIRPQSLMEDIRRVRTLNSVEGPTVFLGDGARTYNTLIRDSLKTEACLAPDSHTLPSASTVAEIAIGKLNEGITVDPVSLAPFYMRKSEAEIHWKG